MSIGCRRRKVYEVGSRWDLCRGEEARAEACYLGVFELVVLGTREEDHGERGHIRAGGAPG
jgi:hypothetical protein